MSDEPTAARMAFGDKPDILNNLEKLCKKPGYTM
jgi:hypothetical protein